MSRPVEGYNMLIFENEDGTVTYTGSFNRAAWDSYLAARGDEVTVGPGTVLPEAEPADEAAAADVVEQPAGNESADQWRAYALTQGATEDEVAGMSRNELRDKYGTKT
jgi:hypothetical protein